MHAAWVVWGGHIMDLVGVGICLVGNFTYEARCKVKHCTFVGEAVD